MFGGIEARKKLEASLLRKLDRRMSILILIYILNYIDRNNAAAARLRGFEQDLHLHGTHSLPFFPSSINMFLNYLGRPSIYLPSCMIIWGGLSMCTGYFVGVLYTRFFLGFAEAAFFPGALFLISKWYKRKELSQRTALLFCGNLMSNAFGSLIASSILDGMDGKFGYAAWRWLFFIEGALTILVALCAIFILPDFPETPSAWLTTAERALAIKRMSEDGGPIDKTVLEHVGHLSGLKLALADWKVWWLALALTAMVVSLSFNAYFPTLCQTMGYNSTTTLLLCVPPWIFATIVAFVISRHSDETQERCWHIISPLCVGIAGFFIAVSTMNTVLRYISLRSYAGFICFLAWASGTIVQPSSKRAVALAFINMVSSFGNVFGSYIWPASWGPTYRSSYIICITMSSLAIMMCIIFRQYLASLNAQVEEREIERGHSQGFRYLL
ncbi:major facilitator superfamily domain-containing protein [Infundibulicybe gibba]|nr:major facilitator superfamily domain-containing protein [Infundibulicybe gibba]